MRKLSVSSMARRSGSVKRKMVEDPSSEEQAQHTSISSDSDIDVFDKNIRGGSSRSCTTRSSLSPETNALSEGSCISDNQSPRLELTQISELEPLDLIGTISRKRLQSGLEQATTGQDEMADKLPTSSSPAQTGNTSVVKNSTTVCANAVVKAKDTQWVTAKGLGCERKYTGIRRFFH